MKKIDLHTHTISTISDSEFDFDLSKVSEYVEKLQLDAIAITNHNTFNLTQYNAIRNVLSIPVFPGIEIDLEGGHLLLIAENEEFELIAFNEKCQHVSNLVSSPHDSISLIQFKEIFPDLEKYLLIPHYDKKPEVKNEIIDALNPHISAGEVASIAKFKRVFKDESSLVPVLFSDIRFHNKLTVFPTRNTFVDLEEITLGGLKSCLFDRSKISLTNEGGNDFFTATDEGLFLSTGLNIILGERSTGKTVTLNKIAAACGNSKYIKQFSLLQDDEERFNETNKARLSLIHNSYLNEFREIVEDIIRVDIKQNHLDIQYYLESLKKFAFESEKKDLFSKCVLFSEDSFVIQDLSNLERLIDSVKTLVDYKEYQEIIYKHVPIENLKNLAVELIEKIIEESIKNDQNIWLNALINDIKRELRIKTTGAFIEDIDFFKIAFDEIKVERFSEVVELLKIGRQIDKEELGKFSINISTQIIEGAADLQRIGRDKKVYSSAFSSYHDPYEYLLKLQDLGVEDASIHKFFIKFNSETRNRDGFKVSGGERSEFNLIYEIQDATKHDMLLIDEPESSFDNIFLQREINSIIKHISTLMPVIVVTHNSTVGASIKPNYIAITEKKLENEDFVYRIYTGYPSDKELVSSDGQKIKNYNAILNCLEAGVDAYNERKDKTYDILKD